VDLESTKQAFRRDFAARRRAIPPALREAAGRAVAAHLLEIGAVREAKKVGLYAATADELPTRPLFEALARTGCRRLLPRIDGDTLEFVCVAAWAQLQPGAFGLLTPPDHLPPELLDPGDVVMVPALVFGIRGERLGRGGGYYDRTFPANGPLLIGMGFDLQLVDRVPTGPHDRVMDALVTERGLRFWAGRA
jgi:5-formyltetrahydrofolate cyclo-ligase